MFGCVQDDRVLGVDTLKTRLDARILMVRVKEVRRVDSVGGIEHKSLVFVLFDRNAKGNERSGQPGFDVQE